MTRKSKQAERKKVKTCWQCRTPLVKDARGNLTCPKNCGPESLGRMFRL